MGFRAPVIVEAATVGLLFCVENACTSLGDIGWTIFSLFTQVIVHLLAASRTNAPMKAPNGWVAAIHLNRGLHSLHRSRVLHPVLQPDPRALTCWARSFQTEVPLRSSSSPATCKARVWARKPMMPSARRASGHWRCVGWQT